MTKLLANPTVRLALRAILAGGVAAAASYKSAGGAIVWHALAVTFVLAAAEVFTPLNSIVGVFKVATEKPAPTPLVTPPVVGPPPGP